MSTITHYVAELEEPERSLVEDLTARMSREDIQQFAAAYRQVRKDPQVIRIMAAVGIVAIPGLQRFWVGQIGMGFLYLLTGGLLWVGTIMDIINYREIAFRYNREAARRIVHNLRLAATSKLSPVGSNIHPSVVQ
jgi:TM2 domain-containing membrane protein YozV